MDWIEDLIEFGPHCVADACRNWRQTQTRRPTPAEIRRLCIEGQRDRLERSQLKELHSPEAMDEYARSVGWKDEAERRAAIARDNPEQVRDKDAKARRDADMAADGRDASNSWARKHGYLNLKDYMKQNGLNFDNDKDYGEACKRISASLLAEGPVRNPDGTIMKGSGRGRCEIAAEKRGAMAHELGYKNFGDMLSIGLVRAVKHGYARMDSGDIQPPTRKEPVYTPEQLHAGRVALGLEQAEAVE